MATTAAPAECLPREELRQLQWNKLQRMLKEVLPKNVFYSRKFADIGPIRSWEEFAEIPFTSKQELVDDQLQHPPYGSVLTYSRDRYVRLHYTSGSTGKPLRFLDNAENWKWMLQCWHSSFRAMGITAADRIFFPFSFGPFLGWWSAFAGAQFFGALCLPGGGMTTLARLHFMLENGITCVCCTPTYALRLVEVANENSIDLSSSLVRKIIVSGEPGGSLTAFRNKIKERWDVRIFDTYGLTEVGPVACECVESPGLMHVLEDEYIAETIDPDTGARLPPGHIGELVLTNLGRWGTPAIRYRTGDLVVLTSTECPSGRTYAKLAGGILSRLDKMIFIDGNNIYPSAIEDTLHQIEGIREYRVTVTTKKSKAIMLIELESDSTKEKKIDDLVRQAIQERFYFRPLVKIVAKNTLPRYEMKARRFVIQK